MDKFLPHDDELGKVINTAANELYMKMHHLDVDGLGMPEHCLYCSYMQFRCCYNVYEWRKHHR